MPDDADHAGRTVGEPGEVELVGAGVDLQVGPGQHPGALVEVVLRVLHGDDPRVLGQPDQGLGVDRHAGATGDVVEQHRELGGVGDSAEMREQPRLRRAGVVGRDAQQAVRAGLGRRRRLGG